VIVEGRGDISLKPKNTSEYSYYLLKENATWEGFPEYLEKEKATKKGSRNPNFKKRGNTCL